MNVRIGRIEEMSLGTDKLNLLEETPVQYLRNISQELGIEFYVKRDDLTPWGAGGNKLRKLEYLVAEALAEGCTTLITVGGAQTNHGRLTAAVAAKFKLKCVIVAVDDYPGEISANILLDRIMGSQVVLKKDDGRPVDVQLDQTCKELTAELESKGEKVYCIPLGGSNTLGTLGYYDCALELAKQAKSMGIEGSRVVTTVGSGGTYLGLFCGLAEIESETNLSLTGISILPFGEKALTKMGEALREVQGIYGLAKDRTVDDMDIRSEYVRGGYNLTSKEVRDAIYLMGRKEAILLDPCYTGKTFAGICDMVKEGKIAQGEKVIFVHTGGFPGLYTKHHRIEFEKELIDGIRIMN